jgi:hypothetical protein
LLCFAVPDKEPYDNKSDRLINKAGKYRFPAKDSKRFIGGLIRGISYIDGKPLVLKLYQQ